MKMSSAFAIALGVVAVIVGAFVSIILMNSLLPTAVAEGEDMATNTALENVSGITLFNNSGAVWTLIVIGVFIGLLVLALTLYKYKK